MKFDVEHGHSKTIKRKKLVLELVIYSAGLAGVLIYYRAHLWKLLSEDPCPLLVSQIVLVMLALVSNRISRSVAKWSWGYRGESRQRCSQPEDFFIAGFLVPVLVVPVIGVSHDLIYFGNSVSIWDTVGAVIVLVLPWACLITFLYGIPVYLLLRRLDCLSPWSLAALGYGFMYVSGWGYPYPLDPIKCLYGSVIATGGWFYIHIAESRRRKRIGCALEHGIYKDP